MEFFSDMPWARSMNVNDKFTTNFMTGAKAGQSITVPQKMLPGTAHGLKTRHPEFGIFSKGTNVHFWYGGDFEIEHHWSEENDSEVSHFEDNMSDAPRSLPWMATPHNFNWKDRIFTRTIGDPKKHLQQQQAGAWTEYNIRWAFDGDVKITAKNNGCGIVCSVFDEPDLWDREIILISKATPFTRNPDAESVFLLPIDTGLSINGVTKPALKYIEVVSSSNLELLNISTEEPTLLMKLEKQAQPK